MSMFRVRKELEFFKLIYVAILQKNTDVPVIAELCIVPADEFCYVTFMLYRHLNDFIL